MKKIIAVLLCVALVAGICSCKKNKLNAPAKIALITNIYELEEDFLNEELWQGIVSFAEEAKVEYTYYTPEAATLEAINACFDKAVEENAGIIVCMGAMFSGAVAEAQTKYPDVKIIAVDVPEKGIGTLSENTHCISFAQEEAGYLAGYGAVCEGFTHLGYFGEYESAQFSRYGYGFVQGAADAANAKEKDVTVEFAFGNDFETPEAAISAVDGWFSSGCEILLVAAGDEIVSKCAAIAVDHIGYIIGTNIDQSYLGQTFDYNPFMTSAMKGLREAVITTLDMACTNEWDVTLSGKTGAFGLESGNYLYLVEDEWLWLFEEFTIDDYNALKEKLSLNEISPSADKMPEVSGHITVVTAD